MAKTQEELKELKEEYEKLSNKLKELTEDELKLVTGGVGENGYKYSFRSTDWVYLSNTKTEVFFLYTNVDTNSDDYKITGEVGHKGIREKFRPSKTMRAKEIYECYKEHGGGLDAMKK